MGVYNPHIPRILGQEFCPIREEGITFSPSVNVVELGHTFSIATPKTLTDARYYIKKLPPGWAAEQVYTASIYPAGLEDKTGPIRSVVIPCSAVEITGAAGAFSYNTPIEYNLQSPGDGYYIRIEPSFDNSSKAMDIYFAANSFAPLLSGKRIVSVTLVYQLTMDSSISGPNQVPATIDAPAYLNSQTLQYATGSAPANAIGIDYAPLVGNIGNGLWYLNPAIGNPAAVTQLQRLELGDINYLWNTPSVARLADKMPWRYQELQRFEQSAGVNRTRIHIEFGSTTNQVWGGYWAIGYAALEILYCEENRVAYGGRSFGQGSYSNMAVDYMQGVNVIPLRNPTTFATNPVLPAGQYSVVVASADIGDIMGPFSVNDRSRRADANTYPTLNALRELYPLSSHTGVQVNVTQTEGEVFTDQETLVLPQLSIHDSTGVALTEGHVYGNQVLAQVYGSNVASQDIYDSGLTSAAYPQVRFYARRFGATTVPLTLSSPTISGSGMSVSITPAQWDALDPIVDGWKEVTLRFPTSPVMGTGTNPLWIWSATGELKGNRWEVLGAQAQALSGTAGMNYLAAFPGQLYNATYGAPTAGAAINMAWYPGTLSDQGTQPSYASIRDTFTRVTANGWGTSDTGQIWTINSGTTSEFSTNGSDARHVHTATGIFDATLLGIVPQADIDYRITDDSTLAAAPLTQDFISWHDVRFIDNSNQYTLLVTRTVANTITLTIRKVVAGVQTVLAGPTVIPGVTPPNGITVRFKVVGTSLQGKAWGFSSPEPPNWLVSATDASLPGAGSVRVVSQINPGNTNTLPQSMVFDNLSILAPAEDLSADAVILFSQDAPAISGFSVTQLNQAVSGIGQNCGINPAFIPSQIAYNQLAWSIDQTNIASDLFSRVVASGWGSATSGQTWVTAGGAADFNVNGTAGTVLLSATGSYRITRLGTLSLQNLNGYVEISSNTAATGLDHWGSLSIRDDNTGANQWYAQIKFNPSGTVQLILTTVTASAHTVLGTVTIAQTYTVNTKVKLRIQATGSEFRGKAWMDGEIEPADWQLRVATSANNVAGVIGTRNISGTGTPLTTVISYDNLLVSNISNGYTEIQRMDTVDPTWKTIMKAYRQDVASFSDYEARVGVSSSYRIRYVNFYGFAGPWSATISSTIAAPGVTATSVGANDHVWIFTTNSVQSGASNLAYCLGWENEVDETFNFPEASGQTFQTMYNRDFVTAFRPSERGGTNFGRSLLVQAAAISPETLEDFTGLRNMAWADVPYICLRDEDGNRWFANVSVPGASVRRDRRLYMAPVTIVEVTDTPTPVDP